MVGTVNVSLFEYVSLGSTRWSFIDIDEYTKESLILTKQVCDRKKSCQN